MGLKKDGILVGEVKKKTFFQDWKETIVSFFRNNIKNFKKRLNQKIYKIKN